MNWLTKIGTVIKPYTTAMTTLALATTITTTLVDCGTGHRVTLQMNSTPEIQTQADPGSGTKITLRSADAPHAIAQDQAIGFSITDVHAQLMIETHKVLVSVSKIVAGQTTTIELEGTLDAKLSGTIYDTQPVGDHQYRMKGRVTCLSDSDQQNCPQLAVDISFKHQGVTYERQFQVENEIVDSQIATTATTGIIQPPQPPKQPSSTTPAAAGTTTTPSTPLAAPVTQPPPVPPPALEDNTVIEPDGVSDESRIYSGNGRVVTAKPPEDFYTDLVDDAPVTQPQTTTPQPAAQLPTSHSSPKPVHEDDELKPTENAIMLENVQLAGGGRSINWPSTVRVTDAHNKTSTYNGQIVDSPGTMMPKTGDNFNRVSPDYKAYGTGYSVSFFIEATKKFKELHPECGKLTIENISQPNGGPLIFSEPIYVNGKKETQHESHQNGLDLDVAYLPLTSLHKVVSNNRVTSEFSDTCNYQWVKLITNIYFSDESMHFVSEILMHKVIQQHLCDIKKKNKYNSEEDNHMFSVIAPQQFDHDDHMHIRLNCSPEHIGCRLNYPPARTCP